MTRICHVTSAHTRYDIRIFEKECCSLAKKGYECYLLVNDNNGDENKNGVKIVSTGLEVHSRKERFLKSHKLLLDKMNMINAEIYHFHDPDLLSLAVKMKKKGKKVIFDFHENVAKQIKDKEWIPKIIRSVISVLYSKYEAHFAKKFDYLITVSPNIVDELKRENSKIEMITNFPIVEEQYSEPEFKEHNICFAGGISEQWCHDIILESISEIDDCKYILAGGTSDAYLDLLKKSNGWNKVEYLGRIPFEDVEKIYIRSIAGMALNISSQVGNEGTLGNTKLFEYMSAGIAVICSNNVMWKRIIEENDCGIAVDPTDVNAISDAVKYLLCNIDRAKEMGINGRKAAISKYNWANEEKKLYRLYEKLNDK